MPFSAPTSKKLYVELISGEIEQTLTVSIPHQCSNCEFDGREENDAFFGVSSTPIVANPFHVLMSY